MIAGKFNKLRIIINIKNWVWQLIAVGNDNKTRDSLNMAKLANNEENLNKTSGGGAIRRVFRRSWNLIATAAT